MTKEHYVYREDLIVSRMLVSRNDPKAALEYAKAGEGVWKEHFERVLMYRVVDTNEKQSLVECVEMSPEEAMKAGQVEALQEQITRLEAVMLYTSFPDVAHSIAKGVILPAGLELQRGHILLQFNGERLPKLRILPDVTQQYASHFSCLDVTYRNVLTGELGQVKSTAFVLDPVSWNAAVRVVGIKSDATHVVLKDEGHRAA